MESHKLSHEGYSLTFVLANAQFTQNQKHLCLCKCVVVVVLLKINSTCGLRPQLLSVILEGGPDRGC